MPAIAFALAMTPQGVSNVLIAGAGKFSAELIIKSGHDGVRVKEWCGVVAGCD